MAELAAGGAAATGEHNHTFLDDLRRRYPTFCRRARGLQYAINTLPHEDWGLASLYTPRWNVRQHAARPGWQAVDLRDGGWGALAFCFTRDSLTELLAHTEPQSDLPTAHADILATVVFAALGRRCYFHLPSLCMHTGDGISTMDHQHDGRTVAVGFHAEGGLYRPESRSTAGIAPQGTRHENGGSAPVAHPTFRDATDFSDATVCVTVLIRFDRLQILLRSIRRFYANIEIVVADNSFRPEDWGKQEFVEFRDIVIRHGVRPVMLPFDSGISATRNAAVTAARTPYVIVCEEDFEFTQRTNLEKLLRPLRAGRADFVGGLEHYTNPSNSWIRACVPPHLPPMVQYAANVGFVGSWPRRRLVLRPVDNNDMTELSGVICRRSDVIHNFYAARRDAYLLGPCDDRIKVCEHLDHFLGSRSVEQGFTTHPSQPSITIRRAMRLIRVFSSCGVAAANYHQLFCDNWGLDPTGSTDFGLLVGLTPVAFMEH